MYYSENVKQVQRKRTGIGTFMNNLSKRKKYYHKKIEDLFRFLIPSNKKILDLGCEAGELLSSLNPSYGVGIDANREMIEIAHENHSGNKCLDFKVGDCHHFQTETYFDYVIMSDLVGSLQDVQKTFMNIAEMSDERTRIVITNNSYLWDSVLRIAERLHLKKAVGPQNWLSMKDINNLLEISDLEIVKQGMYLLIPVDIPWISEFVNKYIARLPVIRNLCLVQYFVARKRPVDVKQEYSVSVIVPARNEEKNIEQVILRTPQMGKGTEIIFVEGGSGDHTFAEIQRVYEQYKDKVDIQYFKQDGTGKGDAVRKGFAHAKGDILMILDADLTVVPEDLPKFYQAIRTRKGDFINGSRLVYMMEKEAMRFLNIWGNKFFSLMFTWLLGQNIKDTLCGTKVIFKEDYEELANNRAYFGDFDPFGDFDLILGAQKLNLKLVEIPVRYGARTYGSTNISRFRHGLLLLRMTVFAARKLKFF